MTKKKVFPEQLHENIDLKNKRLWLFKTYICAESQEKENKNICWTLPKLTTDILWRSFHSHFMGHWCRSSFFITFF